MSKVIPSLDNKKRENRRPQRAEPILNKFEFANHDVTIMQVSHSVLRNDSDVFYLAKNFNKFDSESSPVCC